MSRKAKNFSLVILFTLFFANILAWLVVFDLQKPYFLKVIFFDVGQGDAILIETPKRQQILIDGGPSSAILEKLGKEIPFWDRTIDLIILTHPEKDHLVGLNEVLKRYQIENILWTGVIRETAEFKTWKELIEKEKAKIFIAQAGQRITGEKSNFAPAFGRRSAKGRQSGEFFMEILYPFESLEGQKVKKSNDTSIVAKLVFGQNSFLFTGDIASRVEQELIIRENSYSNLLIFPSLDSDVLKVAHHGSKYSTDQDFLRNVLPEIAVISVGKNPYGHPTEEVLKRLENFAIETLRTDQDGDIKIITDGKNLWFTLKKKKLLF